MEPIFNRHGRTIGWLKNGVIYDRKNCYRAFIRDRYIFTYDAHCLGIIHKGIIFDQRGQRIAYTDSASHDPMLPIPQITPPPPILSDAPNTPLYAVPAKTLNISSSWSTLHWDIFLDG